jgi:hypothetical protein
MVKCTKGQVRKEDVEENIPSKIHLGLLFSAHFVRLRFVGPLRWRSTDRLLFEVKALFDCDHIIRGFAERQSACLNPSF